MAVQQIDVSISVGFQLGVEHQSALMLFGIGQRSGRRSHLGMPVASSIAGTRSAGIFSHCRMALGKMPRVLARLESRPRSALRCCRRMSMAARLSDTEI